MYPCPGETWAGKRAPILMTFYLTDDSRRSDFVSYISKPLIINLLREWLIDS